MNEPTKDDVVAIFDKEIDLLSDSVKSSTIETWALVAALGGLLTLLAAAWEVGGQTWEGVSAIVLGCFFLGEALGQLLRRPMPPVVGLFRRRRFEIGIPMMPIGLGILVNVALLALLMSWRPMAPHWVNYLCAVPLLFRLGMLLLGSVIRALEAGRLSFTNPRTPKWMLRPNFVAGYARGVKAGLRISIPDFLVYSGLGLWAFHSGPSILSGQPLTDVRFGVLAYATVCVVSMLLRPTDTQSLPALVTLRRDLLANVIAPRDAYLGVSLSQTGVSAAPAIVVGKDRVKTTVDAIRKYINDNPAMLSRYRHLSATDKKKDPLYAQLGALEGVVASVRAEVHSSIIIHPEADPVLLGFLREMEKCVGELKDMIEKQEVQASEAT